ncbi:MAG: glycosyltransferase [Nitrospira sp. CR2.1]|nr:glycosyltransferase [Nitrospira sp. CR2.1]
MTPRPHAKALLLQLEFPTWKQARAWTYPACFGVAQGLRAAGVDCITLPLIADAPYSSTAWLAHMRRMIKGQRFDQVWVWLVHAPLDDAILNWLSELAPIRVGIIMESLQYGEDDYTWAPHLRARQGFVEQQVRTLTHVLVPDECDVERTAARTGVPALWWPPMVPERFINTPPNPAVHQVGVFHGVPYGPREQWIHHPALKSRLTFARPSAPTLFQQLFDRLQQSAIQRLSASAGMPAGDLTYYTTMWQEVREGEFREWMAHLPQWAAIVNLPSLAKFFGGRVFEGIAAGRPVVSYAVPGHPLNNSLFVEGEEILYFSPSRPESLAEVLDRLLADATLATRLAGNAQRKLRTYHTSERRLAETLGWIQSGITPEYAERERGAAYALSSARTGHAVPADEPRRREAAGRVETTIFILTVDDPAFPACKAAVDAQQGGPFHVEIIRNVAPFSAAAQRTIAECRTEFFIQVDEDMILTPDAATRMTDLMRRAPADVGMVCFHLYDEDRACRTQGVKIYRTAAMKPFAFQDVTASEMDLFDQMSQHGVRWVLHPDVLGRQGTLYTPDTIYRRYKTLYEKDIRQWNTLTSDIRRKADQFRTTGDLIALFALLGAAHGIIEGHRSADRDTDARAYGLNELDIFDRLFRQTPPASQPYDQRRSGTPLTNSPLAPEEVRWVGETTVGKAPQQQTLETAPHPSSKAPMDQNAFYVNLFVNQPAWSTPEPNPDEAARWSKIASFLEYVLRQTRREEPNRTLRILDVGCGRGWLTNLATAYGTCEGIEPVAGVVEHARRMFPHIRFEAGTPESVLQRPDFVPYDVALCSEVIEHVPHAQKPAFVNQLARLLTPDGHLILTTPRGDVWEDWRRIAPPNQPVEDWVTEAQLGELLTKGGFQHLGLERIPIEVPSLRYIPSATAHDERTLQLLPIYQVWACRRRSPGGRQALPFTRKPMVSVIVPTFNRPQLLRVALESLNRQQFQDFEVIVVNDGRTPVDSVIAEMNQQGRITLVNHDRNRGLAASRNTGLRVAQGRYVAYLDDDDRLLPEHLDTLVEFLERGTHQVAYTDAWRVTERGLEGAREEVERDQPYTYDYDFGRLLVKNYIPVLCLMHRRTCLDDVGGFDESLFVHEDWDLWIRLGTVYPFAHIARTTAEFTWRTDGTSMTSHDHDAFCRTTDIIYRKYFPYVSAHPRVLQAQREHLAELKGRRPRKTYDCSIIIPVWNNAALTQQCLQALAEVTDGVSYEVVVVDNGSSDGVETFLQTLGGDVQVIRNEQNLGFSKACNQGARAARGEFLVFLNNDTIPLKGWLTALVDEARAHADVAVVGSKLLFEDGTIQHAGVAFSREWFLPYHLYRGGNANAACVSRRRELQCVTAACMLVRRTVFDQAGGFDEGYRNGFEDVDLCLKIRKLEWKIVYQPKSVLYHLESKTPGRKAHELDNSRRLHERWGACWWLADEDLLHFEDGYAIHTYVKDGMLGYNLERLADAQTTTERAMLADVQRSALRQESDAVAGYLRRVQEWPADVWILRWGTLLCTGIAQPQLAIPFWERILSLEEDPYARIALAKRALEAGALHDADRHLTVLLEHEPSHAEGWLLRGILAMQRNAYRDAEQAFEQAKRLGADQRKATMGMVMAAIGDSRPEAAWSEITGLCAHEPDDEECMHWLLRCGTMLQRWNDVGTWLSAFLGRNPGNLAMRFALAGVLLRAGRRADAQREYDCLRALAPDMEGLDELKQQLAVPQLASDHAA